jgi:uncharacterized membrane protein
VSRVEATVTVKAGARDCFDFVAEPSNTPRFMIGMKSYHPIGRKDRGQGARFISVIEIAGGRFESELETTEYVPWERITGVARSGPKTRGGWTFQEYDDGTTDVTLAWDYELPAVFRLVPGVGTVMERGLRDSLKKLKRLIEADFK